MNRYFNISGPIDSKKLFRAFNFMSDTPPFSFLPETRLKDVVQNIEIVIYKKGELPVIQNDAIKGLYIVRYGAIERYYEEESGKKLKGILEKGEVFGGISILMNSGLAIRSFKAIEPTKCYILNKEKFLELCEKDRNFSDFFTNAFGRRMLSRAYSELFVKQGEKEDDKSQFFNTPIENIYKTNLVSCNMNTSIQEAACIMSNNNCSSILIQSDEGQYLGIVTDADLRKKVTALGCDIKKSVFEIMSSPLATIKRRALVFELLITMMQKNLKHIVVTDEEERVAGIVTNQDIIKSREKSPVLLIKEIAAADSIDKIIEMHGHLPQIIRQYISAGVRSKSLAKIITEISDSILNRIISFTLDQYGPPPVDFVFMIMGSEGRGEQTLKTDQDNAIIYQDPQEEKDVNQYFLKFGDRVCTLLDQAGYNFCGGGVMAKNPKWCKSISAWKKSFSDWINAAEPEDLLHSSIFFDFRGAYGNLELIKQLRSHLFSSLSDWGGFFRHLSINALHFKPPIGFFRNFVVESKGKHRNSFDIKGAMMPIVDFARIFALKNRVEETNTFERLHKLYIKKILTWKEYNEIEKAYSFLMQLRFARQISAIIDEKSEPDNYINPKKLSSIEQTMLKRIFKKIESCQSKLGFNFIGIG